MQSAEQAGLVYDERYLLHDSPSHPENAQRLRAIVTHLREQGVLDKLKSVVPAEATIDQLEYVHAPEYIETIRSRSAGGFASLDLDTYVNEHSFDAARLAAGGCISAVDAILDGDIGSALCLVRPPGHHAEPDRAMGFCLFNNAAIAARHALLERRLDRIVIVDWDVHHGNGTQAAFYRDPRVLYFSVHQQFIFPGTGAVGERGAGEGEGHTINVPLPGGCGDADYEFVLREVLVPACEVYRPQLVIVSAGQDAHARDPLANMNLTSPAYGAMAEIVRDVARQHAGGRVMAVLEGGYSRTGAPEAALYLADVLADLGLERPASEGAKSPRAEVRDTVRAVRRQVGGPLG